MASVPKSNALETLLTEIPKAQPETGRSSADDETAFAGKVIILMILGKRTDPMTADELMRRSELPADHFERNLAYLVNKMRWVETHNNGYQLTDAGREAAERERKRLLSFG